MATDAVGEQLPAVRIPETVLSCAVGGEAILLDLGSGQYYGLNSIGSRFWSLISATSSASRACDELAREYAVEPARLREDLAMLLEQLEAAGLIELERPGE